MHRKSRDDAEYWRLDSMRKRCQKRQDDTQVKVIVILVKKKRPKEKIFDKIILLYVSQ